MAGGTGKVAAIVLAGGLGTRLRGAVADVPKPLVPVKVVYGFVSTGRFIDIGTPESYARAPGYLAGR